MQFSIIIPHHTESIEQMRHLFNMLDMQLNISKKEYEILIINDVESAIITDYSSWPELQITNIQVPFSGYPGLSRQAGLDKASGDWIIFIDADDLIASIDLLASFNYAISQATDKIDVAVGSIIEEIKDNNINNKLNTEFLYKLHDQDFTWVFSKIYNREFLTKNNIRFTDKVNYHEDTYFNALVTAYEPCALAIDPFYIWRYNKNSITRQNDGEYTYSSICTFIDAVDYSIEELISRGITENTLRVVQLAMYQYYCLNTIKYQSDSAFIEAKSKIEHRLGKFMQKYKECFNKFKDQDLTGWCLLLKDEYAKVSAYDLVNPIETFEQFYNRLVELN